MNILHLTPDFNYSDGRSYYVFLLLKYLKKAGHDVLLCTNSGNSIDSTDRLKEFSIPVFTERTLSDKHYFLRSVNTICKITEKYEIDIIHSHHRYYELLANAVRKKLKVKTVFTALSIVDRRYFVEYKSDKIISVSNSVREMLIKKFNVRKNRIELIPNFTDTEELDFIKKSKIQKRNHGKNVLNILSAGRLHKEKDFPTLLNAISILNRKDPDIRLTILGEGQEEILLKKMIKDFSINAEILPPRQDIYNDINNSDICVLSSIRDPLPGFMLQSGLFGKPFIGSDVDGIADTIKSGVNGFLFKKKNPQDLADKILLFIEDKALAEKCSENLNHIVLNGFTEKTVIPDIECLYKNL